MALLRQYELFIGTNQTVNDNLKDPVAGENVKVPSTNVEDVDKTYRSITTNQFTATVKFPKEGKGSKNNTQTITIVNPDDAFIDKAKVGGVVVLKAGYNTDPDLPLIFAADIITANVKKDKTDRMLEIVCAEAYQARKRINYPKSFARGTTASFIIEDIFKVFSDNGIGRGLFKKSLTADKPITSKKSYTGLITKTLDDICAYSGHRWYIAAGRLWVEPLDQDKEFIDAVVITDDVIVNSIEIHDDTDKKNPDTADTKTKGIKVTVLLNGNITKSSGVIIPLGDHKGLYVIESVTHSLDYEGNNWTTTIEARG